MTEGARVYTPRFATVTIDRIFPDEHAARAAGFVEPTHYYDDPEFGILGKHTGINLMVFAAYRKKAAEANKEKTYWVTFAVDGRFTAEVKAKNPEEASKKAEIEYYDADFGELHDIVAYKAVNCEGDDGSFVDY